jgi:hypothetical protein
MNDIERMESFRIEGGGLREALKIERSFEVWVRFEVRRSFVEELLRRASKFISSSTVPKV